jgi:hypothetical protein
MRAARITSAPLERLFCIAFSSGKMLSRKIFQGRKITRLAIPRIGCLPQVSQRNLDSRLQPVRSPIKSVTGGCFPPPASIAVRKTG